MFLNLEPLIQQVKAFNQKQAQTNAWLEKNNQLLEKILTELKNKYDK